MLSTEENKNALFPSRQDHCFKHGCWDSKDWHSIWQVLELWHYSHTQTSPCTVTEQASSQTSILMIQTTNATLVTQQSPDWSKWVLHRQAIAVLGKQRTCTTCSVNGEWTFPATKSSLTQTGVRKWLFKNSSREDPERSDMKTQRRLKSGLEKK